MHSFREMAAPAEGDEHIQNNNEETLQLSFPVPPSKYFKKYRDADIKCGTSPLPPKVISGAYSIFGDAFEVRRKPLFPSCLLMKCFFIFKLGSIFSTDIEMKRKSRYY